MKVAFEQVPDEFVSKTDFYDYKEPITEALAKIKKYGAVVVTKNKEYYGIVDNRSVVRKGTKIGKGSNIGNFAAKAPLIDSNTTIEKAIHQFYTSSATALPYYERNKISGIVNRRQMLKAILSLHMLSKYYVSDVMSTPVVAIDSEATVSNAKSIMRRSNLKHLVVVSNGRLDGILTSRHILEESGATPSRLPEFRTIARQDSRVGDVAERNVHSIEQDDGIDSAIRSLVENRISSLVVTKSGKPSGIITVRDIFEAVSANASGIGEDIMISGLDEYTREFREDILAELEGLEKKINRFHKLGVDSIAFNIKRHRAKNYEMKIRVWLSKRGVVSSSATGFSLEGTLRDLVDNVYNSIKEKKEVVYTRPRRGESGEANGEEQ